MSQPNGNSQATKVGYIGLGNAGYPLSSTLARAGYHTTVQDADPDQAATETADAFSDVDVLVTMLPNGEIVRDVLLGSNGVAKTMKNGAVIVDTSSSSPFHTRETGKMLEAVNQGLTLIDSPVTQEYAWALGKGDATLMVGCSNQSALEIAMPILKTMARHAFVMGELGAGHAMKTLNNYTSAASIMGLCDALIAGQKFGLDPAQMVDVMNVGTGVNFSTKESFRTDGLTRRFSSGYQLSLLLKDMKIARTLIDGTGPHSALSDLIVDAFADSDKIAGPGADHTQVIQGWEQKAGIQLKQSKAPEE
ncbi:hypothetical protein LTR37_013519 [Vermiconidia calcicola]|uniref:Uncharacterized protein n=1 Tax=Vermiconidia calcicola TaxID=1690605 RepID=A0ACC3MW96_9PEZI|nr:hypothetical protein LTR37_013519 [Vermiconidia calcicola]